MALIFTHKFRQTNRPLNFLTDKNSEIRIRIGIKNRREIHTCLRGRQWWTGGVAVVGRWLRGGERETERESNNIMLFVSPQCIIVIEKDWNDN